MQNVALKYEVAVKEKRILLIIPCYNEQENVGQLLAEIQNLSHNLSNTRPYDTLVIDDCSEDKTFSVASTVSPCIRLLTNLGIGGAVQTGIKFAFRNGYDFCVQVDGDAQHPPEQIERLLQEWASKPANIIIGSRFLLKEGFLSSPSRRMGILLISQVIRVLFACRITDPTSGLRLLDREAMRIFSEYYPSDFPEPISNAYAVESGLTLKEIPILMRQREAGKSSLCGIKSLKYMVRVIGYLILLRLSRHF